VFPDIRIFFSLFEELHDSTACPSDTSSTNMEITLQDWWSDTWVRTRRLKTNLSALWYIYIYIYIFNCNWVDTRWQHYSSNLHTNSTQNTENGTYITITKLNMHNNTNLTNLGSYIKIQLTPYDATGITIHCVVCREWLYGTLNIFNTNTCSLKD
jgi:hypothetical protein